MKLSDFDYSLPQTLIAKEPLEERSQSRLLCLNKQTGELEHRYFSDIISKITENDCIIFNNTKVIPARLYGKKDSGGQVEILISKLKENHQVEAMIKASKAPKTGCKITINDALAAHVLAKKDNLYVLQFESVKPLHQALNEYGEMPLPPYIKRPTTADDKTRYQTVYAEKAGAVAAPTAGLHFDDKLLAKIKAKGASTAFVTLHVGLGTFAPVRTENIREHKMHSEYCELSQATFECIQKTKASGGKVIAVGTTSLRTLEAAAYQRAFAPFTGETDIFITPGYSFKVVDSLITNFHLPKSTLLMLVSAFSSLANILNAYQAAITAGYRFFSYGDAMFID